MATWCRPPALLTMLIALAACASLDPSGDLEATRLEVEARAGIGSPLPGPSDDAAAALRDLLARPLDEEAAVRVLFLANHRVQAAWERLGIARADLVQAGLLRNPVFDLDARFLFDGGTELELGLAQPFVDLFWRPLRQRLAEHEFAAARLVVTDALVHAVFAVRRAFVDLRAAGRRVALHRDNLQTAASAHQLAVELHAAGNLTDQALAVERAGETRARLDLAAAEAAEVEARESVHAVLGLWGDQTSWTLAEAPDQDPLAGIDTERIEARAIAASLDLAAARAGADAMAQRHGLASWRGLLPDAAAGLSAVREAGGDWGIGPRIGLELPLFDTGAAGRARAAAAVRSALHDHAATAVEVRSMARRLRSRLVQLAARERFLRDVHLPQRAEVLHRTLQQYNAMQIGVFDVLRQRRQQLADQLEHLAVHAAALHARLDLQQLLAGSLPKAANADLPAMPVPSTDPEPRAH